jgi:hypothetical protein
MKLKRLLAILPLLLVGIAPLAPAQGWASLSDDDIGTLPRPHSEEEVGWIGAGFDVAPDTEETPSGWVLVESVPIAPATTADLWLNVYTSELGTSQTSIGSALASDDLTATTVPTMETSWKTTMPNGGVIVTKIVTPKPDGPTSTTTGQWAKAHKLAVDAAMKLYPPDPPPGA